MENGQPTNSNPPRESPEKALTPEDFGLEEDDIRPDQEEKISSIRDDTAAILEENYNHCQPDLNGAMSGESDRLLDGPTEWDDTHTLY